MFNHLSHMVKRNMIKKLSTEDKFYQHMLCVLYWQQEKKKKKFTDYYN